MQVKIIAVNQDTGEESPEGVNDLLAFFDDCREGEYLDAYEALQRTGRYYAGGGAAQLFLLMRA